MLRRSLILLCLLALGASLGGCTKCGWIWNDTGSCRADLPRS